MHRKFRELRLSLKILVILGMIALAAGFTFLYGLVVMLLWNWLMPDIFGLARIDYWHAWGVVLLSHILFKSWGGRRWAPRRPTGHGPCRPDPGEVDREPVAAGEA